MSVAKIDVDDLGDVYELLGVDYEATEKDINHAYRKSSLTCHPDRNQDDVDAAAKFEKLTRAKEALLDPKTRAVIDEQRKAKRALEERFAQDSSKRRKFREDLESRENAASDATRRRAATISAEETRLAHATQDWARLLKNRRQQRAAQHTHTIDKVMSARKTSQNEAKIARLVITWREGTKVSADTIDDFLSGFGLRSLEIDERTATAQFRTREDAIRATLHWREQKHALPFRVDLVSDNQPDSTNVPKRWALPKRTRSSSKAAFTKWEEDMLERLAALAAKQRECVKAANEA
jgi:curved DNA-binding protein CbpA